MYVRKHNFACHNQCDEGTEAVKSHSPIWNVSSEIISIVKSTYSPLSAGWSMPGIVCIVSLVNIMVLMCIMTNVTSQEHSAISMQMLIN
jgi:hypothetical protein